MIICPVCLQPIRPEDPTVKTKTATRHAHCPVEPTASAAVGRVPRARDRDLPAQHQLNILAARLEQLADGVRHGTVPPERVEGEVQRYLKFFAASVDTAAGT